MDSEYVPPEYREPHYSTKLFRAYFYYLDRHHSRTIFEKACEELGMPLDYITSDDGWVSHSFTSALMEKLKAATGDPMLAEKIGRETVNPQVVNFVEYTLASTISFPLLFYWNMPSEYKKYNNINRIRIDFARPGKFRYIVEPKKPSEPASEDVCFNTIGVFTSTQHLYSLDEMEVKHTECIHHGASKCVFEVNYSAKTFWKRRMQSMAAISVIGTASILAVKLFTDSTNSDFLHVWTWPLLSFFLLSGFWIFFKRYMNIMSYIAQYTEQSRLRSQELYEKAVKLDQRYKESNLLKSLSVTLIAQRSPAEIIRRCLDELEERFGYPRLSVMLLSSTKDRLHVSESRGFSAEIQKLLTTFSVAYPATTDDPQFFAKILENSKTQALLDLEEYKKHISPQNAVLIDRLGVTSLVVAPIQDGEDKYGLLIVGSAHADKRLTDDDSFMIENISRLLSLNFQQAKQLEKERSLRRTFQKYVPAIVLQELGGGAAEKLSIEPQTTWITSFFLDLRNFTKRSEKLRPDQVVDMVNLLFRYVTPKVAATGGIIDKFVGDAVVAFYPAMAHSRTTHSRSAIVSALAILSDIEELNREYVARGYGEVDIGIGLHTGQATLGTIGNDEKLEITALGDTVNIAARLQDLSKEFAKKYSQFSRASLVISKSTYDRASLKVQATLVEGMEIRGRSGHEDLYYLDEFSARKWFEDASVSPRPPLAQIVDRETKRIEESAEYQERRAAALKKKKAA